MDANAEIFALVTLAEISAGHPVRGAVDTLPVGDVALLQMRDISEDGIAWSNIARVTPPGRVAPNYLQRGDILFTSRGTRNIAVMITSLPGRAICAPNLFILRVRDDTICLPAYLTWYMNQRPAQAYFERAATGSSILNIRREALERLDVPIPPLPRQQAIVAFADAARAERKALLGLIANRNTQLDALALSLAGRNEV